MTSGGNLTLIVILLILWFVGIFLAGYFGYEHFDKHKKSETNLILFVLGVVLAIGTFIGIIVLFIKRSRLPKKPKAGASTNIDSMKMDMESAPMLPPAYAMDNYGPGMPSYPAQSFPGASYSSANYPVAFPGVGGPVAGYPGAGPVSGYPGAGPGSGYPVQNPYLAQQYSI